MRKPHRIRGRSARIRKGEMQVRKAAARAVIWVCDYNIGYHGRLIEQALISIAVSTAMAAFMIGLVVLTL